jgi:hypothetical protein
MTSKFCIYQLIVVYRAVTVGWGFINGDPVIRLEKSDYARGGPSASSVQQYVDLPIIAPDQVRYLHLVLMIR